MHKDIPNNQESRLRRGTHDYGNKFAYDEVDQVNGEWNRLLRKLRQKYNHTVQETEAEIEYLMEEADDEEYSDGFTEDPTIDDP
jgi:hypothetical protein